MASVSELAAPTSSGAEQPRSRRRVFHLIKGLGRGGAETLLLECLRAAGGQRYLYGYGYLLPRKSALAEPLRAAGAEVFCLEAGRPLSFLGALPRLVRLLRSWRPDLLHCHLPVTGVLGRLAGRLLGVPVVYTEHNLQHRYRPLTRWLNRATWRLQRRAIAVSVEVAAAIGSARRGVPITVLPNGVSTDRFAPDPLAGQRIREHIGIDTTAPVVGTVTVLRAQKNLGVWLETAQALRRRRPEVRFLLVGDGPLRADLAAQASELGLDEALHWAGLQAEVRPYLAAMDVFFMSSHYEGLPVALLEAMAMARPVVATAVGGVPEAVVDGVTGHLISDPSAAALAPAIDDLLADAGQRRVMGDAGRARVVERFGVERMLERLEAIYDEVLDGGT